MVNTQDCIKNSGAAPHPINCLLKWWKDAGCSLDGSDSPIYNPNLWQTQDVDGVQSKMALHRQNADKGLDEYTHKCLGLFAC